MTPIWKAPITEVQSHPPAIDNILTQVKTFDAPGISISSMIFSSINAWGISTDVGTLDSDELRRISLASSPASKPSPPRSQKRKLSLGIFFPKTSVFRSTTSKPAANLHQPKELPKTQKKLRILHFFQKIY